MKTRIITALFLIAAAIIVLFLGGLTLDIVIALAVIIGCFELFDLLKNYKKMPPIFYGIIALSCAVLVFIEQKNAIPLLCLVLINLLALPVYTKRLNSLDALIMCAIYILMYFFAYAFRSIYMIDSIYIWYIVFATYACDTGAYFAGYFFGKRKLCERLSPKKTMEGSIGGILFSLLLSVTFAYFYLPNVSWWFIGFASLTLPIVSQVGDLSFSAIKRYFNIKDFSNIFPGHGGILDRMDSLLFNSIYFYCLLQLIV